MRTFPPQRVVRFDAFTLDLSRCVVLRGDAELPLRPKAFDMLRYLAEHPGRLLLKDELLGAVWPGVTVSDDSLVRCIKDIRQALGDRDHRIIKTVPKRGYVFTAEISGTAHPALAITPVDAPAATTQSTSRPVLHWTRAVGPFLHRRHRASLLVAGALVLVAGAGGWALWNRPAAHRSPHSQAGHYAILGRALMDHEHSAKANKEALALFDKALALDPNSVPALLGYARVMLVDVTDGWAPREEHPVRFNQAEAAIERVIELDPTRARAHHLRGLLWRARGDPDRALAAFQHALALDPGNAWTHAELGRNKIDVGRADEAISDIETAIRLSPAEPRLFNWYYWAGMAAVHAGKSETALQWLLKWREPNQLYYRFAMPWLAVAHAEVGREDEGRTLMAEYLARHPSFAMSAWDRAFPRHNPVVGARRERIAKVLRRLGVPEGIVQTGSVR